MKYPDNFINKAILGDCLEVMKDIPDASIDMILCDLPYGTTACKWDTIIPMDLLWLQYLRIIKNNGAMVFTATQPFASLLVSSQISLFKHHWIWDKRKPVGFQVAKYRPMMQHEDILVFCKKKLIYNPIMTPRDKVKKSKLYGNSDVSPLAYNKNLDRIYNDYYPKSIIVISNANQRNRFHPTQKPVELFEYLIKTYTNENMVVLDNCAGSGTTGIAARNTNRSFILIEKEEKYYNIINERLKNGS